MEYNLQIEGLSKQYDNFKLNNISFNLPKGCIMGFIGENGAGKTTTINLLLNLIKKDSGNIKIFGLDNIQKEKEIKEQIGVVLDESFFHNNLKPTDISKIMKNTYKTWDNALFNQYLRKFKIPENKIIKELSKGMRAKLEIATALGHKPKLLILDEATSGLDPVIRNEILDIFLDFIQDEENSILISSHITSDLEKVADYITFIHDGNIIFCETKDNLIYSYGILKCGLGDFDKIDKGDYISYRKNNFGYEFLVKNKQEAKYKYKNYIVDNINIEDIMLFYIKGTEK